MSSNNNNDNSINSITVTINGSNKSHNRSHHSHHHKNSSPEPMMTTMPPKNLAPLHPLASSRANSIANYSYPRYDNTNSRCSSAQALWSPSSTTSTAATTPLDMEDSSPPGLIDDRTDSEASGDDEHHYQAHTDELFNTFWKTPKYQPHPKPQQPSHQHQHQHQRQQKQKQQGKTTAEKSLLCEQADAEICPLQKYPALIPSPMIPAEPHGSGQGVEQLPLRQAWPLSNHRPDAVPAPLRIVKKPVPEFPPRTCSRLSSQTQRPSTQPSTTAAPTTGTIRSQQQALPRLTTTPPRAGYLDQRKGSCPNPTIVPWSPIYASNAEGPRSATHIPLSPVTQAKPPFTSTPLTRTVRNYKSTNHLNPGNNITNINKPTTKPSSSELEADPKPRQQEEPRSVFECDSDSDSDDPSTGGISPTLSFFRFHKRGESRRSAKTSISHHPSASITEQDPPPHPQHHRRRSRPRRGSSITAAETPISPLQPRRDSEHKHKKYKQERGKDNLEHDAQGRERKQSLDMATFSFPAGVKTRQNAVLSRMLGRRKR